MLIYTCDLRDTLHYTRQIAHFYTPDVLRDYLTHDLSAADTWAEKVNQAILARAFRGSCRGDVV